MHNEWQAWRDSDGAVDQPPLRTEATYSTPGRMHCECGASFGVREFDAWDRHDCEYRRAQREAM